MPLVRVDTLLEQAQQGNYAVGAFNANNMEIVQAIIQAAELERSPVIMQASQGAIRYAGLEYITGMVRIAAENSTVPVALHLDHGTDFDQVIKCIRSGFTSVMFERLAVAPGRKHRHDQKDPGDCQAHRGIGGG